MTHLTIVMEYTFESRAECMERSYKYYDIYIFGETCFWCKTVGSTPTVTKVLRRQWVIGGSHMGDSQYFKVSLVVGSEKEFGASPILDTILDTVEFEVKLFPGLKVFKYFQQI